MLPSDMKDNEERFFETSELRLWRQNMEIASLVNEKIENTNTGAKEKARLRQMAVLGLLALGAEDRSDPTHVKVSSEIIKKIKQADELEVKDIFSTTLLCQAESAVKEYNLYLNTKYQTTIETSWILKETRIFFITYLMEIRKAKITA
jgi:hypothetical protein